MEFDLEASASETIKAAGFNIGEEVPFAILNPDAIAAAVVDIDGNLHAETSNFFALNIRHLIDDDIVLKVAAGAEPVIETCEADGLDGAKETILLAYASTRIAKHWRLPISMKNACNSSQTNVVVLTTVMLPKQGPIEFACRAYGLTGLQTKVLVETLMTGSIRQAAIRLGIAYQTAREAVSYARSRIGESRLPALIHRVASLAFGILPDDDWAAALIDLWGLSARQAALDVRALAKDHFAYQFPVVIVAHIPSVAALDGQGSHVHIIVLSRTLGRDGLGAVNHELCSDLGYAKALAAWEEFRSRRTVR